MSGWKEDVEFRLKIQKNRVVTINLENKKIEYTEKLKQHRSITTITGDEEVVRAHLINRLVNELDYKPELIELEKEYNIGRPKVNKARIDMILKDDEGNPFFFVEVKAPDKFESDREYIEGQLYQLAKLEKKVKYLVYYTAVYQGDEIQDRAIVIDFEKYPDFSLWEQDGFVSVGDELSPGYDKPKKQPIIKGDPKNDLRANIKREEIEGLGKNLHNVLWGGGGTNDSEIFYSLVNIILAKIQDESEKEDGQEYDFQVHQYGENTENTTKVFDRINGLYKRALKEKLNISDIQQIEEARVIDRNKFPINKLMYTVQALEQYSFLEGRSSLDGKDILGDFFESITRDGFKQTKGQFFTPTIVVNFILYGLKLDEYALDYLNNFKELPLIIDSSAGSGTFLVEAMKFITKELKHKQFNKIKTSRQIKQRFEDLFMPDYNENRWAKDYLYGTEINFDLGTASKVNMILHGDGASNIFVKDGLLPFRFYNNDLTPNLLEKSELDPLYQDKEINGKFDVVISNPPFSVNLDTETKRYLPHNYLFANKKNSENLFIERWYQLLKEKGRLGVVLPESIFDTSENKYIRLFLFKHFNIKAVVSLPQVTFEPFTSTKTSILFAQKKTYEEVKKWDELWHKYGNEWSRLKTRVQSYLNYYINGKPLNKKWAEDVVEDIESNNEENIRLNIKRFLKNFYKEDDDQLDIKNLLTLYIDKLNEVSTIDKDTQDVFGFYNVWWVFGEIAIELNYNLFMAQAKNVGFKRTKRGEKVMPNDLYDIEYAPLKIDPQEIHIEYDEKIVSYKALKAQLENERSILLDKQKERNTKKATERLEVIISELEEIEKLIQKLEEDRDTSLDIISNYYIEGVLIPEYEDRTDPILIEHFKNGLLSKYKSVDILINREVEIKILDTLRKDVIWG